MFVTLLCWSVVEVFGKLIYSGGVSPITILQVRYVIATSLFFLTILLIKKLSFKVLQKDWLSLGLSSVFLTVSLITFWYGLRDIKNVAVALAIFFTYPIVLAIASSLLFKEKFSKYRKASLALGITGVLFSVGILPELAVSGVIMLGAGYMAVSSLTWAGYFMASQNISRKYSPYVISFWSFLIATVAFLLIQNPIMSLKELNIEVLRYLLFLAVFSTYIGYSFLLKGIKYLGAASTGIVHLSRSVASVVLAFIVLHERPSIPEIIGVVLVCGGVYLLGREKRVQ